MPNNVIILYKYNINPVALTSLVPRKAHTSLKEMGTFDSFKP